ncbi:MAG: hypothetical protein RsTaC01_0567 [Candidatus Paraimprobicoccus trichonymphae]|uniref:Uncharacterized protein n=1 Tax=Candidatus Paraimprobicoccus trichonymphae TaxID=3033793 RepID=A0AA48HWK7_9FIRM|nr:MAG: hypothetical protein RsTaC01_0567 [Candidatus Paraimprobicoccus trichonymphae]
MCSRVIFYFNLGVINIEEAIRFFKNLGVYEHIETLGTGGSAVVCKVEKKDSKTEFAVRVVIITKSPNDYRSEYVACFSLSRLKKDLKEELNDKVKNHFRKYLNKPTLVYSITDVDVDKNYKNTTKYIVTDRS